MQKFSWCLLLGMQNGLLAVHITLGPVQLLLGSSPGVALGLPVVCLDLHGARDVVPDNAGFKVSVTTQVEVTDALAAAMDRFSMLSRDAKQAMSAASLTFARSNTWPERAKQAEVVYQELLTRCSGTAREVISTSLV